MIVRHKELQQVEVVTKVDIICDKCNEKVEKSNYDAFRFDFEVRFGESYPEGVWGDKHEMDLCQDCTDDLLKLLENNGYRITKTDL